MIVSIFADASWCPDLKVGGWGAWARSDRGYTQDHGGFSGQYQSPADCESMALANASSMAFRRGIAAEWDRLILTSDCAAVVQFFQGTARGSETQAAALEWIRVACAKKNVAYEFRHVQGHKPSLGGRNQINHLCHKLARRGLMRAREIANKPSVVSEPRVDLGRRLP